MRYNQVNNLTYLKHRRRDLRANLTPAEAALWAALKGSALKDKKFRRQHSVGNFIVDFYCPAEKLVIELDGEVHNDPMQSEYDAERSKQLAALGYRVIRFENRRVFDDLVGVLAIIADNFTGNK